MASMRRSRPDLEARAINSASSLTLVGRAAGVALIAALLCAVTLRTSIADVFQANRPARALAWNPGHVGASATIARRAIVAGHIEDGRRLAAQALARGPINATAYSVLALADENSGDLIRARELMVRAHALSRREWLTEMWLIRQAIGSLDYAAAVRHFDIAMRTSSRGVSDLMPLLVASTADPQMIAALSPVLARDPDWKTTFLMSLSIGAPNVKHVVELSRGRLDPRKADERAVIARLIQRLVDEREYDLAWSVYREARPEIQDQAAASVRDVEFASAAGFPPFDWQLAEQPDLAALRETRRDGRPGFALALISEEGRAGEVARQLVRLRPGTYDLKFEAGAILVDGLERPQISLACADVPTPFYQTRPPKSDARQLQVRGAITVPAGCRWQTVSIRIGSNETATEFPWIANIRIVSSTPGK